MFKNFQDTITTTYLDLKDYSSFQVMPYWTNIFWLTVVSLIAGILFPIKLFLPLQLFIFGIASERMLRKNSKYTRIKDLPNLVNSFVNYSIKSKLLLLFIFSLGYILSIDIHRPLNVFNANQTLYSILIGLNLADILDYYNIKDKLQKLLASGIVEQVYFNLTDDERNYIKDFYYNHQAVEYSKLDVLDPGQTNVLFAIITTQKFKELFLTSIEDKMLYKTILNEIITLTKDEFYGVEFNTKLKLEAERELNKLNY